MAVARTGVFVDDYLEYSSTLPAELQRLLNTMRELDERSRDIIIQTGNQTKYCMKLSLQSSKRGNEEETEEALEKMRKEIETHQDSALNLCTEKVSLARLAYDLIPSFIPVIDTLEEKLIDSHVKRLDEDLHNFAEDLKHGMMRLTCRTDFVIFTIIYESKANSKTSVALKSVKLHCSHSKTLAVLFLSELPSVFQEGKIAPDEPAILPPLPLIPKDEKRKPMFGTPQSKRFEYRDRDWDRGRDIDFELMPPPGGLKKSIPAAVDVDQPIDPNEPTYCVCHQVSFGDMIACDNENCQGGEWFHYSCVGLTPETRFKGKWYCPTCRLQPL
ncbi:hypothetical protein GIB67_010042 [Kingdonia uniflora]|uniref:PHD finger protein ING n=1 Tax=Kingdonia uniflora TaxID=39325 RepID=A0A7J7KV54_9MAGN|nr:hypothetical protein GIB67_010042 [Kingdonia uniflora]